MATKVFLFLSVILSSGPEQDPTVVELEEMALGERREIRSASIKVHAVTRRGDQSPHVRDYEFTLDTAGRLIYRQTAGENDSFTTTVALTMDEYISFEDQRSPRGTYHTASIRQMSIEPESYKSIKLVVDPRLVGMVPGYFELLRNYELESYVGNNDRTEPRIEWVEWESRPVWKVTFNRFPDRANVPYELFIDPDVKSVVCIRSKWTTNDGDEIERFIQAGGFQQYGPTRTWFPTRCEYKKLRNGEVEDEEQLEITVESMNEPFDPQIFSFANLGVPDGAPVSKEVGDSREFYSWTDGQLVPREVKPLRDLAVTPELTRNSNAWLWATVAGVCTLIAIVIMFLYVRQTKASRP